MCLLCHCIYFQKTKELNVFETSTSLVNVVEVKYITTKKKTPGKHQNYINSQFQRNVQDKKCIELVLQLLILLCE